MAIPVTLLRIAADELLVELPRESSILPGMVLRLDDPDDESLFAEVRAVEVVADALRVSLLLLQGQPGLSFNTARIMQDDALRHEVQRLSGESTAMIPLMDDLRLDVGRLGTLSVVAGEPFETRFTALMGLVNGLARYRKVLLIDPLGLFDHDPGALVLRAGEDVRLSIQAVGLSRFLQQVAQTLPEPVQAGALQILMRHAPISPDFIPFKRFLNLDKSEDNPVKSALLYNLYEIYGQNIFADEPEDVLDPGALENPLTVLDLSPLSEPWKSLFYRQVLADWLADTELELTPALIYPEQYLESLSGWVPQAEAQGLNVLAMVSPYEAENLPALADNWIEAQADGRLEVRGSLTMKIPVRVLPEAFQAMSAASQPLLKTLPEQQDGPMASLAEFAGVASEPEAFRFDMPGEAPAEPQRTLPTWADLGWQPPPDDIPGDEPLYDSILGDLRALEQPEPEGTLARPFPTSEPPPSPSFSEPAEEEPLAEADEELSFAFDWQGETSEPETDLEAMAADETRASEIDSESFRFSDEPLTDLADPSPDEAPEPVEAPLARDEVPVYQTRQLEPMAASDASEFSVGDRVRHPKHGEGVIRKKIPMDDSVILNIQFDELGKCLVDPRLAPLEKIT